MNEIELPLPKIRSLQPTIKIKTHSADFIPHYATPGASGADVKACIDKALILEPQKTLLVPTGLFLEIPPGWEVQIRPRSGLALKNGITVLNTPGTIDSDYRGQVQVLLINFGVSPFTIEPKMRIAQMVISPSHQALFDECAEITETHRGSGGFGHTGV